MNLEYIKPHEVPQQSQLSNHHHNHHHQRPAAITQPFEPDTQLPSPTTPKNNAQPPIKMVAISRTLVFGIAATFSALVSANNCKDSLFYCGTGLLNKGLLINLPSYSVLALSPPFFFFFFFSFSSSFFFFPFPNTRPPRTDTPIHTQATTTTKSSVPSMPQGSRPITPTCTIHSSTAPGDPMARLLTRPIAVVDARMEEVERVITADHLTLSWKASGS